MTTAIAHEHISVRGVSELTGLSLDTLRWYVVRDKIEHYRDRDLDCEDEIGKNPGPVQGTGRIAGGSCAS